MNFKLGEWVTNEETGHTFLIVRMGDWPVPGTTHTETDCLFDVWGEGNVEYWCHKATQEEIEQACAELDEDISDICKYR